MRALAIHAHAHQARARQPPADSADAQRHRLAAGRAPGGGGAARRRSALDADAAEGDRAVRALRPVDAGVGDDLELVARVRAVAAAASGSSGRSIVCSAPSSVDRDRRRLVADDAARARVDDLRVDVVARRGARAVAGVGQRELRRAQHLRVARRRGDRDVDARRPRASRRSAAGPSRWSARAAACPSPRRRAARPAGSG